MATTQIGRQLTEAHRVQQARLAATVITTMRSLWRILDPNDIDGTTGGWLDAALRLIAAQHARSASLAGTYYRAFRIAEVGQTIPPTIDIPALNVPATITSLMVTGPVKLRKAIPATLPTVSRVADASSAAAASRQTLTGGRDTITRAIRSDGRALGYARATSGDPCAFCALLAGKGPVYGSEASASFQAHDGCACSAEPVFDRSAPFPGERFKSIYDENARGVADPLNAFRRAYEGRSNP